MATFVPQRIQPESPPTYTEALFWQNRTGFFEESGPRRRGRVLDSLFVCFWPAQVNGEAREMDIFCLGARREPRRKQ